MGQAQSRFEEKLARSSELRQAHLQGIVQVGGVGFFRVLGYNPKTLKTYNPKP